MGKRNYKTNKVGTNRKGNGRNSKPNVPGNTPDNRKDLLDRNAKSDFPNNPLWYYGDAVLGDEISRFSFNQFAGYADDVLKTHWGNLEFSIPTICVLPLNPCPGVTRATLTTYDAEYFRVRGINQSLQAWWSLLTSRSGRGATYSKVDFGMLILAMGEIISMVEYARRFFGVAFTYNLRNRTVPAGLIRAMGVDDQDFLDHLADYRLRLNSLILRLNKIPIPGNIPYFNKCQDLYQKVYVDSVSDMAQTYVWVPATTWVIDESLSSTGTVLVTKPAFYSFINDTDQAGDITAIDLDKSIKQFSFVLDTIEQQLNALVGSSTFSNIYSDLINAASLNNVSLWTFELVPENYAVMPEYDQMMLLMIHNAMPLGDMYHKDLKAFRAHIDAGIDYISRFDMGTPLNDVYCDPDLDIIVHNPSFVSRDSKGGTSAPILFDMLDSKPSPEVRIEAGVYKFGIFEDYGSPSIPGVYHISPEVVTSHNKFYDFILPDHYLMPIYYFTDATCQLGNNDSIQVPAPALGSTGCIKAPGNNPVSAYNNTELACKFTSMMQWAPLFWTTNPNNQNTGYEVHGLAGELNYWTILSQDWIKQVTDAKYIGLFNVR